MRCPICDEELGAHAATTCAACGGTLPPVFAAAGVATTPHDAITSPGGDGAPPSPSGPQAAEAPADPETLELLHAFESQFLREGAYLPASWRERLARLALEAEPSRRVATVFFVDLRGYTRMSAQVGEARHGELRRWFAEVCMRRVEEQGGFVIQFLGDAAYAAFGAPWAFERDAEAALMALLAIREDIRRRGTFDGHELAVRAGAASGVVNVGIVEEQGRRRPDLFGDAVNLAARLEAFADTWEILASDLLASQVAGVFEMEPREAFEPKNYGRVVRPMRVVRHLGAAARRRDDSAPFVGRPEELATIRGWVEAARDGGFVVGRLTGGLGFGKSRLLREALGEAERQGARVLSADGEPRGTLRPFGIAARLLGAAFGARDGAIDWPAGLGRTARRALGCALGLPEDLAAMKDLPAAAVRAAIAAGWAEAMALSAAATPTIVVVDDLQWIDPLSAEALAALVQRAPPAMLVLASRRSDPEDAAAADEAPPPIDASWPTLALGPLDPDACRELVRALAGPLAGIDPELKRRLLHDAERIPFFIVELASRAAQQPAERLQDPSARPHPAADEPLPLGLSPRVLEAVQARLDALDAGRRAILQCAAVIGHRFVADMLDLFDVARGSLLEELLALKGLRMLRDRQLPDAGVEFAFTPSLLRDVAYHALSADQRTRLHASLAARIEEKFAARRADFAFDLAHHWLRAEQPDRARPHLRRAALRAIALGGPREALALLTPLLEPAADTPAAPPADPLGDQQRALLLELAGKCCRLAGSLDASNDHYRAFLALAERLGNARWIASGLRELAWNALAAGDAALAERLARQAPRVAGEEDIAADLDNILTFAKSRRGLHEEALAEYRARIAALDVAAPDSPHLGFACSNAGQIEFFSRGDPAAALPLFDRALAVYRRQGALYLQSRAWTFRAMALEKLGRLDEADDGYAEASRLAEETGYLTGLAMCEANRANLFLVRRRWDEAREAALAAVAHARASGRREIEGAALENLGLALAALGHRPEAEDRLADALRVGMALDDTDRRLSPRLAMAWVALMAGDEGTARRHLTLLPPDGLPPALASWRLLMETAIAALAGAPPPAPLPTEDDLERDVSRTSPEHRARWLDVLDLLRRRGADVPPRPR